MDRGTWWVTVHWVAKSLTRLSDFHFHFSGMLGFIHMVSLNIMFLIVCEIFAHKRFCWLIRKNEILFRDCDL